MSKDTRSSTESKFVTVLDTHAGYCQVCHQPRVVAKIAVAGWQHHGTICGQCLSGLADELHRRGKGLAVEKVGSNGNALTAIRGGNGHSKEPIRH